MLKPWLKSSSDNVPPFPQASTGCATPAPSAPPSGAPPPGPAPRGAVTTFSSLLQTSPRLVQVRSVLRLQWWLRVRGALHQYLLQLGRRPRLPLPDEGVQGGDRGQCCPRHVPPRVYTCLLQVCQLRLNFDTFVIGQPSTSEPGDTDPNSRGSCIQVI